MPVAIKLPDKVKDNIVAITKKDDVVEGIIDLVMQELIRKKTKYLYMSKNFEKKYGMTFKEFEKKNKNKKMDYETEKDYFDWDMALTALEDIDDEFKGA
jgi:hypothetical protein